jgi:hypothetical protein
MEIYTNVRMSEIVNDIDVQLKAGKLTVGLNETLWVGLRKNDCWLWNSGVTHCYSGWHNGYPTHSGGLSEANFTNIFSAKILFLIKLLFL